MYECTAYIVCILELRQSNLQMFYEAGRDRIVRVNLASSAGYIKHI